MLYMYFDFENMFKKLYFMSRVYIKYMVIGLKYKFYLGDCKKM